MSVSYDGFAFQRDPDGGVTISHAGQSVTIDFPELAARMCARGVSEGSYLEALAFHNTVADPPAVYAPLYELPIDTARRAYQRLTA